MKIYLDAKDLIEILQSGKPCNADKLIEGLRRGNHQLVLSFEVICEISAPLAHPAAKTNVMTLLNCLEEMPIAYIHPGIEYLELQEAVSAFSARRECNAIAPFVDRFDEAVDPHARPATAMFINYPLAQTVWDLHCYGSLNGLERYAPKMRALFSTDRNLKTPPTLKAHFPTVIERQIKTCKVSCAGVPIQDFARWVYANPNRCPSIRIGYEVWHQLGKNKTDSLEDSDMEDYQHVLCLPYVDLMTLDRRMRNYVSQAAVGISLDYGRRIFKSVQEILCRL
jgi:hypothetical protein